MKNPSYRHPSRGLPIAAALLLGVALWPVRTDGQAEEQVADQDPWARYEIILQRNIFSRNRRPFRLQREEERPAEPVTLPDPESYYLLKGIVQEDGAFIAFVEDKRDGSVLRLREGDRVARGTVESFSLDGLAYRMEEEVTRVMLGSDLQGGYGAVTATDLMDWSGTSATPAPAGSGETPAPSADEAEILRRLMEQRRQQLGQ
jgi:hypothetical protein